MTASRASRRNLRAALPGVPTCPACEMPREEGHACAPLIVNGKATRRGRGLFGRLTAEEIREEHAGRGFPPPPAPLRQVLIAASVAAGGVDAVPLTSLEEDALARANLLPRSYGASVSKRLTDWGLLVMPPISGPRVLTDLGSAALRVVAKEFTAARVAGKVDDDYRRTLASNLRDLATAIDRVRGIGEESAR